MRVKSFLFHNAKYLQNWCLQPGWWGAINVFTPARQGLRPGISNSSPTGRQRLQISAAFLQLSARVKCLVATTDWLSSSHLVYKASVGY